MIKKCSKCLRELDELNFNWKIKGVRLQYHCKECSRRYIREHYKNNRGYYLKKAYKRNLRIKDESFDYIGSYFKSHPCVDCGEADILVLEFDHKIRSEKYVEVSRLIKNRGSLKKLIKEISKCEVRCANCHRRKTAKEDNSWRLNYK